jgi:precorrin-6Y C5,15-methyltransferase (decarboxylating) CbiT subunit
VLDVGAGTGSIAIEAARVAANGRVYAIEKDEAALELIRRNCLRFGVENVVVVPGRAPEAFAGLPDADRIFVGGSGPETERLLERAVAMLRPKGRILVAAVTLDTLAAATSTFDRLGLLVEVVSIAVSRSEKVGGKRFMRAQNQVYLISGDKA